MISSFRRPRRRHIRKDASTRAMAYESGFGAGLMYYMTPAPGTSFSVSSLRLRPPISKGLTRSRCDIRIYSKREARENAATLSSWQLKKAAPSGSSPTTRVQQSLLSASVRRRIRCTCLPCTLPAQDSCATPPAIILLAPPPSPKTEYSAAPPARLSCRSIGARSRGSGCPRSGRRRGRGRRCRTPRRRRRRLRAPAPRAAGCRR